jgi:DNA-binding MarR family transcriptional regulator
MFLACRLAQAWVYTRIMDTLCYCAAVRAAARKTTALYDAILAPAGLTLAQYSLMRRIERAGTVSLTRLGRLADLDRSTVGRNVKALEALGLVRVSAAEDQREAAVSLARAGQEALRRAAPLWKEAQRRVEAQLGSSGAGQLLALAASL